MSRVLARTQLSRVLARLRSIGRITRLSTSSLIGVGLVTACSFARTDGSPASQTSNLSKPEQLNRDAKKLTNQTENASTTKQRVTPEQVDHDYEKLVNNLKKYHLEECIQKPIDKFMITLHGPTSSGKSSLVNDLLGFSVQPVGAGEEDTSFTIIFTEPEVKFRERMSQRKSAYDPKRLETLTQADFENDMPRDIVSDIRCQSGAVLLLGSEEAKQEASAFGLSVLADICGKEDLRGLVVNEKVYELHLSKLFPNSRSALQFDSAEMKMLSDGDRVQLCKRLVLVDTPGLQTRAVGNQDVMIKKIGALVPHAARSFFLIKPAADSIAMEVFTRGMEDGMKSKGPELWNRCKFLLTRMDAPCSRRWFEAGKLVGEVKALGVEAPVAAACMSVALPSRLENGQKYVGSIPALHQMLLSQLSMTIDKQIQKEYAIVTMANHLIRRCHEHLGDYLWSSGARLNHLVGDDTAYRHAKKCKSRYEKS